MRQISLITVKKQTGTHAHRDRKASCFENNNSNIAAEFKRKTFASYFLYNAIVIFFSNVTVMKNETKKDLC